MLVPYLAIWQEWTHGFMAKGLRSKGQVMMGRWVKGHEDGQRGRQTGQVGNAPGQWEMPWDRGQCPRTVGNAWGQVGNAPGQVGNAPGQQELRHTGGPF